MTKVKRRESWIMGVDGFTTKPISVETIENKISALLTVGKSIG